MQYMDFRRKGFTPEETKRLLQAFSNMRSVHGHIDEVGLEDDFRNGKPINGNCWRCGKPRFLEQGIVAENAANSQKRNWDYEWEVSRFVGVFEGQYLKYEEAKLGRTKPPLLLRTKFWKVSFVEARTLKIIISFPSYPDGKRKTDMFKTTEFPELAGMDDEYLIAKKLLLGEIIDCRDFPNEFLDARMAKEMDDWTTDWAQDLAQIHIDRASPSFEATKERMAIAYKKLFELEQSLRFSIEYVLKQRYGDNWWDAANIDKDIKDRVLKHQADRTERWVEVFNPSILRFTFFDDLERIIGKNWDLFKKYFSDLDWFNATMGTLSTRRNHISHFRSLSQDNIDDFVGMASRIIKLLPDEALPK